MITLTDPTYNEPITNVFHEGTTFKLDTAKRQGPTVTFKNLEWVIENGNRLKQRIEHYQKLIDANGDDKETILAKNSIDCAKRHLLVYDQIYIPRLEGEAQQKPILPKVVISPEPILSCNGQFSLF